MQNVMPFSAAIWMWEELAHNFCNGFLIITVNFNCVGWSSM